MHALRYGPFLQAFGGVALLAASVLTSASPAKAAFLGAYDGTFNLLPTLGNNQGLIFTGTGLTPDDVGGTGTEPLPDIDFVEPINDGTGDIVLSAAAGDFTNFPVISVSIQDLCLPGTPNACTGATFPPPSFDWFEATAADGSQFKFIADVISFPEYSQQGNNTSVSVGVSGRVVNLLDPTQISTGFANFSSDFAGRSISQVQALFDEPGESFGPQNWSADFVVSAPSVPESSNSIGLLVLGLVGGGLALKKQLQKS